MAMYDAHGVPLAIGDPVAIVSSNSVGVGYVRKQTPKSIGITSHSYLYRPSLNRFAAPSDRVIALSSHPDRAPVHRVKAGSFLVEVHDTDPVMGWEVVQADDYSVELTEADISTVDQSDLDNHPDLPMGAKGSLKVTKAAWPSGQTYHIQVDPEDLIKAPSGNPVVAAHAGSVNWVSICF